MKRSSHRMADRGNGQGNINHIKDLLPDPKNARRHNPTNIGMIGDALQEVGVARSIVIDENGMVLAGNGVLEAAGQVGIEKVQVIDADGETIIAVRRKGLTTKQKKRLALFDNRTGELASWDREVIGEIIEQEVELLKGLFSDDELKSLLEITLPNGSPNKEPMLDSDHLIEIRCRADNLPSLLPTLQEWMKLDGVTIDIS